MKEKARQQEENNAIVEPLRLANLQVKKLQKD